MIKQFLTYVILFKKFSLVNEILMCFMLYSVHDSRLTQKKKTKSSKTFSRYIGHKKLTIHVFSVNIIYNLVSEFLPEIYRCI